jgi:hypothetical protein
MSTIKPRDLVRTPSGATGTVVWINADGTREIQLLNGTFVALKPELLYVVRAAELKSWPDVPQFIKAGAR